MGGGTRITPYLPFLALMLANFLEVLNSLFVNISMPVVAAELQASTKITHWFFSSYALGFALTLVLSGSLADRIGHRRVFLAGATLYILTSLACALSNAIAPFLLARVAQGAAFAMTAPQIMALLHILYTPEKRVKLMPALGLTSACAGTFGPVIAGLLMGASGSGLGWRAVFLTAAGLGTINFLLGFWLLPRHTQGNIVISSLPNRLIAALCISAVMLLFEWLGQRDDQPYYWITLIGALPLALLVLVWRGKTIWRKAPLDVVEPAAKRQILIGAMLTICFSATSNSIIIISNHLLQTTMAYSPFETGALHIPYGIGLFAAITIFSRFLLKRNGRFVIVGGVMTLGTVAPLLAWVEQTPHAANLPILLILALAGIGVGMTSGCIGPASLARMPLSYAGTGAALLRLGQQLGTAFGGAIILRPYFHLGRHTPATAHLPLHMILLLVILTLAAALAASFPKPLFPRLSQTNPGQES